MEYTGVYLVLVDKVFGVKLKEEEPVNGLSVTVELFAEVLIKLNEEVGDRKVDVNEAVIGSSVLPRLRLDDELRVLVKVPVALMVLVRTLVLSSAELVKGV